MQPKNSFDSANKYCITFLLAKTINENKSIAAGENSVIPIFTEHLTLKKFLYLN